jgi:hypothetical protein
MVNSIKQSEKLLIEFDLIKHFMKCITHHDPRNIIKLDNDYIRSRPDFAFYYDHGLKYTVELERWLPSFIRKIDNQANNYLSKILPNNIPGTFIWMLPIEQLSNGELPIPKAKNTLSEIKRIALKLTLQQSHQLSEGILSKVSNSGSRIVFQLTMKEPVNIAFSPRLMRSLKKFLDNTLQKAEKKFYRYRGVRILLLHIEQSGLDIDYHANKSKYSDGIIRNWLQNRMKDSTRVDYVCVSQGMRVWHGADVRIITGHKYIDLPMPNYKDVWRRTGFPSIFNSFSFFSQHAIFHS